MPKLKYIDSLQETEKHLYDNFKNTGYEYHHHILRNMLSPELFGNPMNDLLFRQIEKLFECLIDMVKQIKLAYVYIYQKNAKNIN